MIAAMIMCHKNLEQVHRLVQALSHPEIDIFVHIDQKCTEDYQITRANSGALYFVENRISGYLDDRSLIDITLSMIKLAKSVEEKKCKHYEYFMLLSGQDYPIRDMSFIVKSLGKSYPTPFIDCNGGGKNNPIIQSKFGKRKVILKLRFYATHKLKWFPRFFIRAGTWLITNTFFCTGRQSYRMCQRLSVFLEPLKGVSHLFHDSVEVTHGCGCKNCPVNIGLDNITISGFAMLIGRPLRIALAVPLGVFYDRQLMLFT